MEAARHLFGRAAPMPWFGQVQLSLRDRSHSRKAESANRSARPWKMTKAEKCMSFWEAGRKALTGRRLMSASRRLPDAGIGKLTDGARCNRSVYDKHIVSEQHFELVVVLISQSHRQSDRRGRRSCAVYICSLLAPRDAPLRDRRAAMSSSTSPRSNALSCSVTSTSRRFSIARPFLHEYLIS